MSREESFIQDFTVNLWPSSCSEIISGLNILVNLFLFLVHLAQHPYKVVEVFFLIIFCGVRWGFPGDSAVKNLPASARDTGSIPGLGKSPEEEMATHSSILAWKIPWTEEPGRLYGPRGLRELDITEHACTKHMVLDTHALA